MLIFIYNACLFYYFIVNVRSIICMLTDDFLHYFMLIPIGKLFLLSSGVRQSETQTSLLSYRN